VVPPTFRAGLPQVNPLWKALTDTQRWALLI
jgi:hypothetical protein